ncbi:hypothetical protein K525DRAFT_262298 [Schizophyllum commune Loenen D]|nr:hypothetical protein K525DRAFT_262298 [Schizophyllum commune Loenen D]
MASPFVPPLDSTPGSSPQHTPLPPVIPGPPGGPPPGAAPPWAQTPHTPAAYPAAAPPMYPPGYPPYGYGGPPPATPYMGAGYGQPPPPGPPPPARGGWGAGWPPPEPPRSHGWSADPGPHRPPGVSEDYVGYPPQSFTSPWAAQPPLPGGWGAPPPPAAPPPHAGGYGYRAQPMSSAYTPYGGSWGATPAAPYGAFPHDPYGGPPPGTPWAGGPAPVMPPPPIPPAPGPPAAPRGHTGDRVDKFAAGPHCALYYLLSCLRRLIRPPADGPVLNPLLLKVTNATLELHPLLQPPPDDPADRPHLRWNMTFPTSHCQKSTDRPNESWMRGRGDPATFPRLSELRLIPDKTAWTITVRAADPALGVTCGEVIEVIKEDMYKFTGRPDYEALSRAERHAVARAYAGNRAPAPGVVGGALGEGMRRFDFLGANRMFGGLEMEANTQRTAGLPAVFILKCAQPLRAEMEAHEAVSRRIEEEAREREEREERLARIRESRASEAGSRAGSHASTSRAGSRAGEPRTTSRSTLSATGSRAGSRAHSRTSSRHLASVTSTSDEDSSSD